MIKKGDIDVILQNSEDGKTALLKDILFSLQKIDTLFEKKKPEADELKERFTAAERDIIELLNDHVLRLETEKTALKIDADNARKDLEKLDVYRSQVEDLTNKLQESATALENAVEEKNRAEEKLSKLQEQWERIAGR